jgi:hypothetical protein
MKKALAALIEEYTKRLSQREAAIAELEKKVAGLEHAFDDARDALRAAGVDEYLVCQCMGSGK